MTRFAAPAALVALTSLLAACGSTVTAPRDGVPPRAAFASLAPPASTGLEAADGRSSYAMVDGRLRRFDTRGGTVARTYLLPGGGWAPAAVSADGAWVALQRGGTEILVLDAERGTTAHRLRLEGRFRVEAISVAGDFLFLQQDFPDGSYAVRGYDLAGGRLLPGSLGRKGETVRMQGEPGQVVASPDGRWLLTLYVETTSNTAFVHALDLIERVAICVPLPPCRRCGAKDWTLALAADGQTLRAANAAGGRAVIDLARGRVVA